MTEYSGIQLQLHRINRKMIHAMFQNGPGPLGGEKSKIWEVNEALFEALKYFISLGFVLDIENLKGRKRI